MNSTEYWIDRYQSGGSSGPGSRGRLAEFKAETINSLIAEHRIGSVIEFGCGDGYQLSLAEYRTYKGFDVSPAAVKRCRLKFAGDVSKNFSLMADYAEETAEVTLSLDVIYHLMEDEVYEQYMATLFAAALRYVVIYSNNFEDAGNHHCRPREFTRWIEENATDWRLLKHTPNRYPYVNNGWNESDSDFYIYHRAN